MIGAKIKKYRKNKGVSQMELELAIGASSGTISRIESGRVNPTKETLSQISTFLKLSPFESADLFDIDISQFWSELNAILGESLMLNSPEDILKSVTTDFIKRIGVSSAMTTWLYDKEKNSIRLVSLDTQNKLLLSLFKNLGGLNNIVHDLENSDSRENYMVHSVLKNKMTITDDVYKIAIPFLNKTNSSLAGKSMNIYKLVHFPLSFDSEVFGTIGFAFRKKEYSDQIIQIIDLFTFQVSVAIYNCLKMKSIVSQDA